MLRYDFKFIQNISCRGFIPVDVTCQQETCTACTYVMRTCYVKSLVQVSTVNTAVWWPSILLIFDDLSVTWDWLAPGKSGHDLRCVIFESPANAFPEHCPGWGTAYVDRDRFATLFGLGEICRMVIMVMGFVSFQPNLTKFRILTHFFSQIEGSVTFHCFPIYSVSNLYIHFVVPRQAKTLSSLTQNPTISIMWTAH